ncbi:hypothetical protein VFPBJ_11190 [Purpureocillium lilacinum]|uniref:Uncharacterized protein n=1 Tax=Purpureocillium lilacinum TaxID=33203 RepID=A0A179FK23_PURLI|nr:hypothetical protein VFPBJ_11190 [Purpureocillium lilacinum]
MTGMDMARNTVWDKALPVTPDHEVRLLLDAAAVLDEDHQLKTTILSAFGMHETATKMSVQFLDTSGKDLCNSSWSARIRRIENKPGLELTFKKRFDIAEGDIDEALALASERGFAIGDNKNEVQVEWGYMKQTLSISRKKWVAEPDSAGLDLPGTKDSRQMLTEGVPDQFNNWCCNKWGISAIAASGIFGPIIVSRWDGFWKGLRLYIEVWPILDAAGIGFDYMVEASFTTNCRTTAAGEQANLQAFLMDKGWFVASDSGKTKLIMERYSSYPGLENTDFKEF